jgi:hypothetical protein
MEVKKTRKAKATRKPRTIKPAIKKSEEKNNMSQEQPATKVETAELGEAREKPEGTTVLGKLKSAARRERIPLGTPRQKLSAPARPGKVCRWVNDDGGRVSMAEQGGYDFVTDDGMKIGDTNVGSGNQDLGSRVSRVVGTKTDGSPMKAYLMEIDEDLHKEDQAAKAARVKETDDQIRLGNIERKPDDGRYIPETGITYKP